MKNKDIMFKIIKIAGFILFFLVIVFTCSCTSKELNRHYIEHRVTTLGQFTIQYVDMRQLTLIYPIIHPNYNSTVYPFYYRLDKVSIIDMELYDYDTSTYVLVETFVDDQLVSVLDNRGVDTIYLILQLKY